MRRTSRTRVARFERAGQVRRVAPARKVPSTLGAVRDSPAETARPNRHEPAPCREGRRYTPPPRDPSRKLYMVKKDARFDAYIKKAAPFAKPILTTLRE